MKGDDLLVKIIAIYGSPRSHGNTSLLLSHAVGGAKEAGADVEEIFLRDLNISPCFEYYGCKNDGRCVIKDDFQGVYDKMLSGHGIILASPVFFYAVSAHTKILIDRCQSLWVKKYLIEKAGRSQRDLKRKGLLISAGATKGERLFDGIILTVKYFFDVLDADLWRALLYRGLDFEKDILAHPDYLNEAYISGKELVQAIGTVSEKY
jgi:multimeric flavodoxin WrbA